MIESASKNHGIFNISYASCFTRFLFTHRQNCTVLKSLSLLNVNLLNEIPGFPRFVLHVRVQCPILKSLDKNKGFVCLTKICAQMFTLKRRANELFRKMSSKYAAAWESCFSQCAGASLFKERAVCLNLYSFAKKLS